MAVVALAHLRECGVEAFCTSSTGNSSTSFARALPHFPGLRMFLFTAEAFLRRVRHAGHDRVAHFALRDATFVDAFACAATFAARHGITAERGFFNPGRREGLKLAFLEASEQVPRPIDWYVQAVSSAMGVHGTWRGARELVALGRIPRPPRLMCVQQQTCAPMVRAYEDGSETIRPEHVVARPTGIAEAILRGDPSRAYPYVRQAVVESGGTFVAVGEHEIREARQMLEEEEGLTPCFNAAAAFAGLVALVRRGTFPTRDTVLVNLTGSDRPADAGPPRVCWLEGGADGWAPELPDDPTSSLWHNPRRWLDQAVLV
jgi:threonine synthase